MFQIKVNLNDALDWAGEQSGFNKAWGGGNWKDRMDLRKGLPMPNLPSPNIPSPGEHSLLPKLTEKLDEGLTALSSPGSGIHRLGTNVEAVWKGIYGGFEYPASSWDHWMREGHKIVHGRSYEEGDSTTTDDTDSSGDGGPAKPNMYTYNINVGGLDLTEMESERERADRMRRMLAGRYGRGETNLTGGTGFGTGSQRTLGGYS